MSEVDKARAVREARAGAVSRAASGRGTARLAEQAIRRFILAEERRREDELARARRARESRAERSAREERERQEYLRTWLNPRGDRR
jgi:hypothetical protein